MAAIKRTPADIAFSRCVRESNSWVCQRCRTQHPENSRGLDCSHFHSRGKWAVRFNPHNTLCLCTACHFRMGGNPIEHAELFEKINGSGVMELLRERMDDVLLAKEYRKTKGKGPIAAHYRAEFERMRDLRAQGFKGRIEFEEWL